jgi:hydrogenase maturation protein HypF
VTGASSPSVTGLRIEIRGTVQGVGFRPFVVRLAREEGIAGRVSNQPDGVVVEAFGPAGAVARFVERLGAGPPTAARIRDLTTRTIPAEPLADFVIDTSGRAGERRVSIPPDLATCSDCLAELFDPADRRYLYPFINCTHCGPRFTIANDVPYDRPGTSMAAFRMCPRCQAEYDDPSDRRFHAQPNACPECGPQLRLLRLAGDGGGGDPLGEAVLALQRGEIVAVKGLGGFHLACDATSAPAVLRLRARKHRDEKPFAVMARDAAAAGRLGRLGSAELLALSGTERPIVLVERAAAAGLAAEVAPGNPLLGLMLPYTPLHHLLLRGVGRPLVMTSGNLSDEPILCDDAELLEHLPGVADRVLTHDRRIESRCDDSVVRVIGRRPVLLRRARGFVPLPVPVPLAFERPVLGCGGQLKNAPCLGLSDSAHLGPHVGDLEAAETLDALVAAIERMERFLGVRAEVVAHDLHPDYLSTVYARERPGVARVGVQHHHAHVAAVMAEHGITTPVLGVVYDGVGLGTDGALWGGEVLAASYRGFERLATFRPLPLPGGDAAVRGVWRIALAALEDAFSEGPPLEGFEVFRGVPPEELQGVRRMLARGFRCPKAHGVGRIFDGFGALFLGRRVARYEGQVALQWNLVADPSEAGAYPFEIDRASPTWQLDLRPAWREAVSDWRSGLPLSAISGRFHNTLADATAALVLGAAERKGVRPVVLTGGCFQNPLLVERVLERLRRRFQVLLPEKVPPGDGGISLGQAMVAAARLREGGEPCA